MVTTVSKPKEKTTFVREAASATTGIAAAAGTGVGLINMLTEKVAEVVQNAGDLPAKLAEFAQSAVTQFTEATKDLAGLPENIVNDTKTALENLPKDSHEEFKKAAEEIVRKFEKSTQNVPAYVAKKGKDVLGNFLENANTFVEKAGEAASAGASAGAEAAANLNEAAKGGGFNIGEFFTNAKDSVGEFSSKAMSEFKGLGAGKQAMVVAGAMTVGAVGYLTAKALIPKEKIEQGTNQYHGPVQARTQEVAAVR